MALSKDVLKRVQSPNNITIVYSFVNKISLINYAYLYRINS